MELARANKNENCKHKSDTKQLVGIPFNLIQYKSDNLCARYKTNWLGKPTLQAFSITISTETAAA